MSTEKQSFCKKHPLAHVLYALFAIFSIAISTAQAAPKEPVWQLAQAQQQPLLDSLKALVAVESGSGDREGLDRSSQLIYDRLVALGGKVDWIEPGSDTCLKGMGAKQPFRIDGNRAYDLSIGNDKAGVAVIFGAPSNDNEYVLIDSIAPRLYLATRLIMDFSQEVMK